MNAVLYDVALTAYIVATALSLAYLVGRRESSWRSASLVTQAGWVCHTVALVVRGVELGRPPLLTLPEAVSLMIWAAVLLEIWAERQYRVKAARRLRAARGADARAGSADRTAGRSCSAAGIRSAWIWIHVALALLGLAALVLNFAGAVMYVLQERQLKAQAPRRRLLPAAAARDARSAHLRTLTLGFPFLTAGLLLGVLWAGAVAGRGVTFDPLTLLSVVMWVVYAVTLSGRVVGAWRGRRAAYFAILGFCACC